MLSVVVVVAVVLTKMKVSVDVEDGDDDSRVMQIPVASAGLLIDPTDASRFLSGPAT